MRAAPEYKPLVGSARYELISALEVSPQRWKCRVRVHNAVGAIPFCVEYEWELRQQSNAQPKLDLGQCIMHARHGYRAVIVGWDAECEKDDEWCRAEGIDSLHLGRAQPFYHVLVDRRDRAGSQMDYIAQEEARPVEVQPIEHQ